MTLGSFKSNTQSKMTYVEIHLKFCKFVNFVIYYLNQILIIYKRYGCYVFSDVN